MRRRYEEMTTTEMSAEGAGLAGAVAVVPIAAIEQHGPHLPLGTDAMLADAMVEGEGAEELEQQPGWYPGSVGFHLDTGKVWDGKVNNQPNQAKPTEIDRLI